MRQCEPRTNAMTTRRSLYTELVLFWFCIHSVGSFNNTRATNSTNGERGWEKSNQFAMVAMLAHEFEISPTCTPSSQKEQRSTRNSQHPVPNNNPMIKLIKFIWTENDKNVSHIAQLATCSRSRLVQHDYDDVQYGNNGRTAEPPHEF